ncbi:hypothetical protein C8R44DRAFT_747339 [Mycena epipterygia]|nr:hypothetical protein C8R44DRAFT_747339 [Mycena epipterygia]
MKRWKVRRDDARENGRIGAWRNGRRIPEEANRKRAKRVEPVGDADGWCMWVGRREGGGERVGGRSRNQKGGRKSGADGSERCRLPGGGYNEGTIRYEIEAGYREGGSGVEQAQMERGMGGRGEKGEEGRQDEKEEREHESNEVENAGGSGEEEFDTERDWTGRIG